MEYSKMTKKELIAAAPDLLTALQSMVAACLNRLRNNQTILTTHPMTPKDLSATLATLKPGRSAWSRGVYAYAQELIESLDSDADLSNETLLRKALLNGADNWRQYSEGGCALIYNADIAERLCSPSELKRKRHGACYPNARESWLECQARALGQAERLVRRAWRKANEAGEGE